MLLDNFKERLKNIKAIVFDIDGVFSNNIIIDNDGYLLRTLNVKDSFALQHAIQINAFVIGIITMGDSERVKNKLNTLGINNVYLQSHNKLQDLQDFMQKYNLKPEEIMYMGDDIPDYEIMQVVGLPCCPADAAEEIKTISAYISHKKGGEGCVRDIVEQILRAQGKWFKPKLHD